MALEEAVKGMALRSFAPFGPLPIPIGLLDRPVVQIQEPVLLDFAGVGGHMVLYSPGPDF
jgi:hypothetical protein